jgi:hypothetical protein
MRSGSNSPLLERLRALSRTYKTPFALGAVFVGLLIVFAVAPRPHNASARAPESTAEATPGPHECVVCGVDKQCDPRTGQCMFIDHTPLPCVESATYDAKAGFCLPEGAPEAPVSVQNQTNTVRTPTPPRAPHMRLPGFKQQNEPSGSVGGTN